MSPKLLFRWPAAALAIVALSVAAVSVAVQPGPPDRGYDFTVIVTDLEEPHGITSNARGDLFFTQIPTPGVAGGDNKVSMWDRQTGQVTDITVGEPEPTFIDITRQGVLFWTCKSAGVILCYDGVSVELVIDGLDEPSGIAVQDRGRDRGAIYFTELPTPGVPGGDNTVSVLQDGQVSIITMGEPEPTHIAADQHGNLYWTCKSAGVILTRDGRSGDVSVLLDGLLDPVGIALDEVGNLYFTEVPTPGVAGGMNKVWRYGLRTGTLTLIHEGDPEPTDVTASPSGRDVYWTCTVAGVIVHARRL